MYKAKIFPENEGSGSNEQGDTQDYQFVPQPLALVGPKAKLVNRARSGSTGMWVYFGLDFRFGKESCHNYGLFNICKVIVYVTVSWNFLV